MKQKLLLVGLLTVSGICSNAQTRKQNTNALTEAKYKVVKLYPNPSPDGVVSVVSSKEATLHFYIFDLEGVLVYQALLKTFEKKRIETLDKGTYLYSVFENDESIEEGKLMIK